MRIEASGIGSNLTIDAGGVDIEAEQDDLRIEVAENIRINAEEGGKF